MGFGPMRILYIGQKIASSSGGADVVNLRNQSLLESIVGADGITYLAPHANSLSKKFVFGASKKFLKQVKFALMAETYTHVFISQSLLGRVARYVAKKFPNVCIITFFHNIEADYAKAYLRTNGLRTLPFFFTARLWERISAQYSNKLITLNQRDSRRLAILYHRHGNLELPTSFDDKFDEVRCANAVQNEEDIIDYLFVGLAFFANIQGVQWFIDNVMPKVSGTLYVVGNGMEKVAFKNLSDRVHVYGFVPDLSHYYYRARMVVSPIFSGGGMKTKTAEALMYGKTIVGTTEAFEGYETDARCTILANNEQEFITGIETLANQKGGRVNTFSRKLFLEKYCTAVLRNKLHDIL